jgi:succinoglycan biosynthesis protein ExoO
VPKVSVVIPCYNAERYLDRAIASVQEQGFTDWELIAVDDCSTDNTITLLEKHSARDKRIRVLRTPANGGPSVARNLAFDQSVGEFIAILDADDAYEPERLERMLFYAEQSGADLAFDNLTFFDDHLKIRTGRTVVGSSNGEYSTLSLEELIFAEGPRSKLKYGYLKPVFRTTFLRQHALRYSETLRLAEDFDLYLRAVLFGAKAIIVPDAMYVYTTQTGLSSGTQSQGTRTSYRPEIRIGMMTQIMDDFAGSISSDTAALLKLCLGWQRLYADAHRLGELRRTGQWGHFWKLALKHPAALSRFLWRSKLFRSPGDTLRVAIK